MLLRSISKARPLGFRPVRALATTENGRDSILGADMVVVIRHAERVDRVTPSWSALAKRPQDSPLSERGKKQAARLGKWLYGRLPVGQPTAIFCAPFIRCVQTADAVAAELEGLQREGLHAASATQICVEPGLAEDLTFEGYKKRAEYENKNVEDYTPTVSRGVKLSRMGDASAREWPWMLNAADLVAASPRINLGYRPLRGVSREGYEGWVARYKSIVLEIANHPLVREGGTAIVVTHGCPSTHMVKSLCPQPGGLTLPDYPQIKAGNYDGPPLQYTATTALAKDAKSGAWDLAPGFNLFSNEHDPRLKEMREVKTHKVTRYVIAEGHEDASGASLMQEFQCAEVDLETAVAGSQVTAQHPGTSHAFTFVVPHEYQKGDRVRVRIFAHAAADDEEVA